MTGVSLGSEIYYYSLPNLKSRLYVLWAVTFNGATLRKLNFAVVYPQSVTVWLCFFHKLRENNSLYLSMKPWRRMREPE